MVSNGHNLAVHYASTHTHTHTHRANNTEALANNCFSDDQNQK